MKTTTEKILVIMHVVAWAVFFGLAIKIGAILISYGVSIRNPEGAKNLYEGLNFYSLRQFDIWHYTGTVSMMVAILVLEAIVAYIVAKVLSKIKMASPFTIEVSGKLETVSYLLLITWIAAMFYNGHQQWMAKKIPGLEQNLISTEFLFLAGVIFVFAKIFKKGVELQTENELTV